VSFVCSRCGDVHDTLPLSYGARAPILWFRTPEAERPTRWMLQDEIAVLDQAHYFIVGNIEIPILGAEELFCYSVWVSLSQDNFQRALARWNDPGRVAEPPYFGWLQTELAAYSSTLSLKTHVHTREVGLRPSVELEATEHPLAVEQREGITMDRVRDIATVMYHQGS
jgi:hypothetical protein